MCPLEPVVPVCAAETICNYNMHELSEDIGFMVLDYVCPWHEVNEMEGVFPHFISKTKKWILIKFGD